MSFSTRSRIQRLRDGRTPGTGDHDGADAAPVVGAAVQISRYVVESVDGEPAEVGRVDVIHAAPRRRGLGCRRSPGNRPQADEPDRRPAYPVVVVDLDADDGAGDREVAVPPRQLLHRETAPSGPGGEGDAGDDLVRLHRRAPQPGEEVLRGDVAGTAAG